MVCWMGDGCAVESDAGRGSGDGEDVEVVNRPAVVIEGELVNGCSASSKTDMEMLLSAFAGHYLRPKTYALHGSVKVVGRVGVREWRGGGR